MLVREFVYKSERISIAFIICALNCDDLQYSKKEIYYNLGSAHINIGNNTKGCLFYTKSGELGYQKAYDALYDFCH